MISEGGLLLAGKAAAAALGASVAVIYQSSDDTWLRVFKKILLGTIVGTISAPIIVDFFGWSTERWDYWLAAASLGGLLANTFLEIVLSPHIKTFIKSFLKGGNNGD